MTETTAPTFINVEENCHVELHGNSSKDPDPEAPEKARRRNLDDAYKLRVLDETEQCTGRGKLGELLRRECLYASHLPLGESSVRRAR